MLTMTTTWIAVATAFVATAFISKELARRRGRDANFYFFVGLFLGPFAPLMILTPLPDHHGDEATGNQEKHIRFIKGTKCPRCHRQVRSERSSAIAVESPSPPTGGRGRTGRSLRSLEVDRRY